MSNLKVPWMPNWMQQINNHSTCYRDTGDLLTVLWTPNDMINMWLQ